MKTLRDVLTLERAMLGLDLETTGTKSSDRIVEIGLEIMIPGRDTKEYRSLVNPQMAIPPEATKVHGITDEMVKGAPIFSQLADNLLKGFAGADFAGYNVRFDLRKLGDEFRRVGRTFDLNGARILDGFRLWQVAEGRSLEDAINHWIKGKATVPALEFDADMGEGKAHQGLWDVKASTRVIAAQLLTCQQLPRDVQQLHDLCWPGWFDADGKLQWRGRELCLSFGEHRDKPLRSVDQGYLKWMLKKDFSQTVRDAIQDALRGVFPTPPAILAQDADNDD